MTTNRMYDQNLFKIRALHLKWEEMGGCFLLTKLLVVCIITSAHLAAPIKQNFYPKNRVHPSVARFGFPSHFYDNFTTKFSLFQPPPPSQTTVCWASLPSYNY